MFWRIIYLLLSIEKRKLAVSMKTEINEQILLLHLNSICAAYVPFATFQF